MIDLEIGYFGHKSLSQIKDSGWHGLLKSGDESVVSARPENL